MTQWPVLGTLFSIDVRKAELHLQSKHNDWDTVNALKSWEDIPCREHRNNCAFGILSRCGSTQSWRKLLALWKAEDFTIFQLDPNFSHSFNFSFPHTSLMHLEFWRISTWSSPKNKATHHWTHEAALPASASWPDLDKVWAWNQMASRHTRAELTLSPQAV